MRINSWRMIRYSIWSRCIFMVGIIFAICLSSSIVHGAFKEHSEEILGDRDGESISSAENEANERGHLSSDESKLTYVDLNKGIYGVPFGVNLQEVLKWCEENKVTIFNHLTKQEVERKARYHLSKIKPIAEKYDTDNEQLSEMEKELLKLVSESGNQMSLSEVLPIFSAGRFLEDLKNPSFNYKRQEFLVNQEFKDGESIVVNGIKEVCTDRRITNMIYSLNIAPSDSSEKLINDNLSGIRIYFTKDDSGNLVSYATFATFQAPSKEVLAKQYNLVRKVLTDKYGNTVYRKELGREPRKGINSPRDTPGVIYLTTEENTLESDIYHFTGISFIFYDTLLWKKNIILVTKFRWDNLSAPDPFERNFYVIYYEPNITNKLLDSYKQTIKDFIDTYSKEDIKKESQMKENF